MVAVFLIIYTLFISPQYASINTVYNVSGFIRNNNIINGSTLQCDPLQDCVINCDAKGFNSNCIGNTFIFTNIWDDSNNIKPLAKLSCNERSCRRITIIANTSSLELSFDAILSAQNVVTYINIKPTQDFMTPAMVNISCTERSPCTEMQFNIYSDSSDLLYINDNEIYHPSINGIVNIYVENTEIYGLKSSIINALTVFQLNVYCVSGCDSLSIYPPIRNITKAFDSTIGEYRYHTPFNYYNFENKLAQNKPEKQIYAPLGIASMNLTCSPLGGCKTVVFCGIIDPYTCIIETNNDIYQCEIECMNRTQHLHGDMNVYINDMEESIESSKNTGIIYVTPKGISQYINCNGYENCYVICVSMEKTLTNNEYYSCINSTINGLNTNNLFI
eukprot:502092_1